MPIKLSPAVIPDWEAEDEIVAVLSPEMLERADESTAREMLEEIIIDLPSDLAWTELKRHAEDRETPLKLIIPPDSENYDFYLVEFPINTLINEKVRMVRLRLSLDLRSAENEQTRIVAYDLFPRDKSEVRAILEGNAVLDISKALNYLFIFTGLGNVTPLTDRFGLNLTLPFKWRSEYTTVRTSDRMSNPVVWYVTDKSINNGFIGHSIIRAPKQKQVTLNATLACELRKTGLRNVTQKSQYLSAVPRSYTLKE
jgi:hypothetical protein